MIHAEGLSREFKVGKETVQAVRGLDLDVEPGELVAFLGPNGAGKSTSLRMLTTLLRPTSGRAKVAGHDVEIDPQAVRQRIGYVGQGHGAADDQRARDELVTQGRAYGMDRKAAGARADELLDSLQLTPLAHRTGNTLSGGQRRRLDVAIGMVHRPKLLFLDEPSTGLDPQSRANLWDHIIRLRAEHGTTVFVTTHYLDEADSMAERILILDEGRVIADGTAESLKTRMHGDLITVGTVDPAAATRAASVVDRLDGTSEVSIDGAAVTIRTVGGPALLPGLLRTLHEVGVDATSAEVTRPTLDDVFLHLTGRSLRDAGDIAAEQAVTSQPSQTLEVA